MYKFLYVPEARYFSWYDFYEAENTRWLETCTHVTSFSTATNRFNYLLTDGFTSRDVIVEDALIAKDILDTFLSGNTSYNSSEFDIVKVS